MRAGRCVAPTFIGHGRTRCFPNPDSGASDTQNRPFGGPHAPPGAQVSPSLEEQIFDSDTIVRASLLSASARAETVPSDPGVAPTYRPVHELRFTVHEYLKGSGPAEIVVVVRDEYTSNAESDALMWGAGVPVAA